MKKVVILGSTGSIGTQTLEVLEQYPEVFEVIAISAHHNAVLFEAQVKKYKPKYFMQTDRCEHPRKALEELAMLPDADLVVNAISGVSGLFPTYAALCAGKTLLLANKESFVMAGELLTKVAKENGGRIFPIDSELCALWQLLDSQHEANDIEKLILTASGGPFRGYSKKELKHVTVAQALKHPTWKMGKKITIDSATLMNKAFEIIEAHWLYGVAHEKIEVAIHPQGMVHGLVQWRDGNSSAILSYPDMRIAISYALFYPQRITTPYPTIDFSALQLTFEKLNFTLFEGPALAREALDEGSIMPAALCIADEIAVGKFLQGEISFLGIYEYIKKALEHVKNTALSVDAIAQLHATME